MEWLVGVAVLIYLVCGAFQHVREGICVCGHKKNAHLGELDHQGPEPHPGVCMGCDFRCPCQEYKES